MQKHVVIGQAGGPTSVINASLVSLVKKLYKSHKLTFVLNGYEGLAKASFIDGSLAIVEKVKAHEKVPGACLGSGRFPTDQSVISKACKNLKAIKATTLVMIGGNGTMEALQLLDNEAQKNQINLQVIGVPKTVDNDLGGTDHSPGFGSAARYIAQTTKDMNRDLISMNNFEQVRILETMGRNAGWLAAASGLYRKFEEEGPHYIAVPEIKIKTDQLLSVINRSVEKHGHTLIVVSEGVTWEGSESFKKENGREVLGGISNQIRNSVKQMLNLSVRAEILGMNQRSASLYVSETDYQEAVEVGNYAAKVIDADGTGQMISIERISSFPYHVKMDTISFKNVIAEGERKMPTVFLHNREEYYKWLSPLVGPSIAYPSPIGKEEINVPSTYQL